MGRYEIEMESGAGELTQLTDAAQLELLAGLGIVTWQEQTGPDTYNPKAY
jgi:hypothetical protein